MHTIFKDGIFDAVNILAKEGNFCALWTDEKSEYGYYIIKFMSSPHTILYETIIDGQIISFGEIVVIATYLTKLRLGSNWYTKTNSTDVIITLLIIFHLKLNIFVPNSIKDFPGSLCKKHSVIHCSLSV